MSAEQLLCRMMKDKLNTIENASERTSAFSPQHSSFAEGAKFTEAQLESAIIELLGANAPLGRMMNYK